VIRFCYLNYFMLEENLAKGVQLSEDSSIFLCLQNLSTCDASERTEERIELA